VYAWSGRKASFVSLYSEEGLNVLKIRIGLAVFVFLGGLAAAPARVKSPCCFSNPQYAGKCVVRPAKGETCSSILAYLNKASSVGKNYCSNTTIRGGWALATCTAAEGEGQ
jgi:hypothetical protein